ncbi:hypothetical protein ACFYWY_17475 [Streptomyces sp. NPDC002870]|uniref:hypothetical protein n=1 Tax=Streptomyces sp. NPDC002870 TaxID=3364666 RepID=UPI00369A19B0
MNGIEFIATAVATGQIHGVGIGSPLRTVDRAISFDFLDVLSEEGFDLRRDYGPVEIYFTGGPGARRDEWTLTGWSIDLHRLCHRPELTEGWREAMDVEFPAYTSWAELREALSRIPGAPVLEGEDHGEFHTLRAAETKVSVFVVDSPDDERDYWPGHGDVWSVSTP